MRNLFLLVLFFINLQNAWAADIGCGKDTDQNSSVDNWCTGIFNCTDEDGDGYCTNGLGPNSGTDCNDHDFFDYPDPAVGTDTGCSSGQAKACQSDGTYTACQNFCPSDCLSCFYIDTASGSDAAAGSWAAPWKTSAMFSDSDSHPSGWHDPVAGDCFGYKNSAVFADTITYTIGGGPKTFGFYLDGATGNSTNPIRVFGVPGKWPIYTPVGTNKGFGSVTGAYNKVSGFKITSANCSGGVNNSVCLITDAASHSDLYNIIGSANTGTDNTGDIMVNVSTDSSAHHFYSLNHTSSDGNINNLTGFLGYRGENNYIHDFVVILAAGASSGNETVKVKHSNYSSEWNIERFVVQGGNLQFASRNTILKNGLILDGAAEFSNPGGTAFTGEETVQYMTVINPDWHFLSIGGYEDYNIDNTGPGDGCNANYDPSNIVFEDSIVQDSDASYTSQDDRFFFMGVYKGDPNVNEFVAATSLPRNVFYNPNTAISFGIFERNNGITTCAGYGDHSGAYSLSGLGGVTTPGGTRSIPTTGSYEENPSFTSLKVGTCAHCADKGWNTNWGTAGTPTPTPTPTATPTATPTPVPTVGMPIFWKR